MFSRWRASKSAHFPPKKRRLKITKTKKRLEHENSIRLIRVWSDLRFVRASARHRIPAAVTPSLAHHPAARPAAPVGTQRCACFIHGDQAAPCGHVSGKPQPASTLASPAANSHSMLVCGSVVAVFAVSVSTASMAVSKKKQGIKFRRGTGAQRDGPNAFSLHASALPSWPSIYQRVELF